MGKPSVAAISSAAAWIIGRDAALHDHRHLGHRTDSNRGQALIGTVRGRPQ
jgi:hypothetical protein